jgi:hypothetical protein
MDKHHRTRKAKNGVTIGKQLDKKTNHGEAHDEKCYNKMERPMMSRAQNGRLQMQVAHKE